MKNAKTFALSDTEETGDTSLRGAHKDSRHWKFECRREPHEAAQFLRRSLGLWHRRAGLTRLVNVSNKWTLPRSAAFRRYVEGMQKPDSGLGLVADDSTFQCVVCSRGGLHRGSAETIDG